MVEPDEDDKTELLLLEALVRFEDDDHEGVVALLDEALEDGRRDSATLGSLWALRLLSRREVAGDEDLSVGDLAALIEPRCTPEFVAAAGSLLSQEDEHEAAQVILEQLCRRELGADRHLALYQLGLARQRATDLAGAESAFAECVRAAPEWPQGHLQRSRCARDDDRLEDAITHQCHYLSLVPDDHEEWVTLAILHSSRRDWDAAEAAYARAESLDPRSPLVLFNRGLSARRASNATILRACLSTLQEDLPEDWRTLVLRGYSEELEGRPWPAWEAFEEATEPEMLDELEPEDRECAMTHALAFAVEHELEPQIELLTERCRVTFTYSYDVLDQLRRHGNLHALRAIDYAVLVRTELTDEEVKQDLIDRGADGGSFYCFRSYRVLSDTPAGARAAAIEFERALGASGVQVQETDAIEEVEDVYLGVWWIDQDLHCFAAAVDEESA